MISLRRDQRGEHVLDLESIATLGEQATGDSKAARPQFGLFALFVGNVADDFRRFGAVANRRWPARKPGGATQPHLTTGDEASAFSPGAT